MRRESREARVGGESRGREEARGGEYTMRESGTEQGDGLCSLYGATRYGQQQQR